MQRWILDVLELESQRNQKETYLDADRALSYDYFNIKNCFHEIANIMKRFNKLSALRWHTEVIAEVAERHQNTRQGNAIMRYGRTVT
ncbi:hypothetical protein sscle_04g036730 [Sclerotinia sclerotiorum 1980 UF-70]|uniref:Uncharacterized protein n=1 Tax=Sclerotinia sclerotiorum (strain ATCC 18683 / 1980 / Ss-1) TaxID=665079 RepID=A0A1D9Q2X4_SCLS1|nr:hypothetical protein sscle_04g036730 [Sclerotinia sclerotiorum 1980 UF-70]